MNAENHDSLKDEIIDLHKVGIAIKWFLGGAAIMGAWVATLEFREHHNAETNRSQTAVLEEIQKWMASVEYTRWSIQDQKAWEDAHRKEELATSQQLAKQNEIQELRLQRLEDTQKAIGETLSKIAEKL